MQVNIETIRRAMIVAARLGIALARAKIFCAPDVAGSGIEIELRHDGTVETISVPAAGEIQYLRLVAGRCRSQQFWPVSEFMDPEPCEIAFESVLPPPFYVGGVPGNRKTPGRERGC